MAVKVVTAVARIVSTVMLISVAALALLLFGCKVVGLAPYTVLTGSMEPTYHIGSLIYVVSAEPEDIKVGEAITFKGDGLPATHRVVEIDPENRCFYTKGDANDNVDAPVPFEYLVGKPVFTIADFVAYEINTGWTKLTGVTDSVYYKKLPKTESETTYTLLKGGRTCADGEVKIKSTVTKEMIDALDEATYPTLIFTAYAIQAEGMTDAKDAWEKVQPAQPESGFSPS